MFFTHFATYEEMIGQALAQLEKDNVMTRLWEHDHMIWQPEPDEISNRLGWLHLPETMADKLDELHTFADELKAEGISRALVLGMGGSSLAPEVFSLVFSNRQSLQVSVVDSTDPDFLLDKLNEMHFGRTLFIVATKSGGTVETLSFFKYFYNATVAALGAEEAGKHFVAITDPGSKLVTLANEYQFRRTFINDPNIGGRYSALSYFGLVPAVLSGVDLSQLMAWAQTAVDDAKTIAQAATLGVAMGELAKAGRDKLTIITSPTLRPFGDWAEQLIAESTGKEGNGILPVVGETLIDPEGYGDDRFFVYLRLAGDHPFDSSYTEDAPVKALVEAGHPVILCHLHDKYELGFHYLMWEVATAVAGHSLQIHPFNQPNVESAKISARAMVKAFYEEGQLPEGETAVLAPETLSQFLQQAQTGDYISIHAYITPNKPTDKALADLRDHLLHTHKLATTVGYGPRFLHSTGQLHKGDSGNGLFIQLINDATDNAPIPDEGGNLASAMSFDILKNAQALGDAQALQGENRRLIRFNVGKNAIDGIRALIPTTK